MDRQAGAAAKSKSRSLTWWAYALIVIFCGCLITGVLVLFGLSASWCLLSRVARCFSVQHDTLDVALLGLKIWSMPAIFVATLVAAVGQIRGGVVWWNVLIAAALSMLMSSVVISGSAELTAFPVLLATTLVLFVGVQLSRLISNRFSGYPI
ncbi:hypothetical protein HU230_0039525 [Bradyrhizobium quebecense]|uniref:Uncharacterized protein n=1 Tax=Bradyrhizobium quebecense TaxID=2748629 RepID=A0A974AD16_9BRAD|nr:hypothetical protein [Bradyrhizobium quebecense]UGA44235.1 hypothetical protein HU230_0039525 [Bradyrhizobium quebecense]